MFDSLGVQVHYPACWSEGPELNLSSTPSATCSACFSRLRTGLRLRPHTTRNDMLFHQCDFVNVVSASTQHERRPLPLYREPVFIDSWLTGCARVSE